MNPDIKKNKSPLWTKEGILLLDKPIGKTSFSLVSLLRKLSGIKKIGHAGTLDPFATGVMVMLVGKSATRCSDLFLTEDKAYVATIEIGKTTSTFDPEGAVTSSSEYIPSLIEIEETLQAFQGNIMQTPPMFSAKKIKGKKLYELARKGIEVERAPAAVHVQIKLLSYSYPELKIHVTCSKGTYIRSLAHDIGQKLTCGGYLTQLKRTRSGCFILEDCYSIEEITQSDFDYTSALKTL